MPRAKKDTSITGNSIVAAITSIDDKDIKEAKVSKTSKTSKQVDDAVTAITPVEAKASKKTTPTTKTNTKSEVKATITEAAPKTKEALPKPNTITRLELAGEVAKAVGRMMEITNRDAEAIVSEIILSMTDALKSGDTIEIRGFGVFRQRSRRARRGRNPKTGEPVDVPNKQVVYFKMGKDLKTNFIGK